MRRNRLILLAGGLAAFLVLAAPLGAGPHAIPSGNLVQNPGAEESTGATYDYVVPIAKWATGGPMTAWVYGMFGDRPDKAFAATIDGGANFFSGGPGGVAGTPVASQTIDVSAAAAEIDEGSVAATLAAYIGGYGAANVSTEDLARVDAVFYDAAASRLGSLRIGPVTGRDRNGRTVLLKRSGTANLPKLTRRIDVVISVVTDENGKHHAFVDNISLTLGKATTPPPPAVAKPTLVVTCAAKKIVATVTPAKGAAVSSVTFLLNGKPAAIDKKAPFTAKFGTSGLPTLVRVGARVKAGSTTVTLTKAVKRC